MIFERFREMKGLFYRKFVEKEGIEEFYPEFTWKESKKSVEFMESEDLTKINITYPLIEPFAYVNIKWDDKDKTLNYFILEPQLTPDEWTMMMQISEALIELVEVGLTSLKDQAKAIEYLETQVTKIIKDFAYNITPKQYINIMYYIYRNFVGYNEIEPILRDRYIEDISCDGVDSPIYVIHRKYGSLKTNIAFKTVEVLREFVIKIAERCGRYVSYAEPILDGTLPDGSRVSATLAGDVATHGPTFTIRKFTENPFSPIEQISLKTADAQIMAYFWYLIEHGSSILIVGGVATGKTSFLNTIAMFIPPEAKVVSIEDTREIRIPHQHWIPGLSRVGFGIPTPTGAKYGEVTLFDLLKESFRQNPDYVIVGEVRGQETSVMFQGMSSGHPSLSTFHAGSVDTVIKRLTTPPIELSPTLLESLDVIAILTHAREKGKSARRLKEISEIIGVDPKTTEVKTNIIFRWDPVKDIYEKINDSIKLEKIVAARGGTLKSALEEVENRKKVIEWMIKSNIINYLEVTKIINEYYKEPNKFLEIIDDKKSKLVTNIEAMKMQTDPKNIKKRVSLLKLLGFKEIREK